MCGPSRITRRAPGTRSLMPLRALDRRRGVGGAGERRRRDRDLAEPRDGVVAGDRAPAVGEGRRVEREQRARARRRPPGCSGRSARAAGVNQRSSVSSRTPSMPSASASRGARCSIVAGSADGTGAGDEQRAHAVGMAYREVQRDHAPSEHAGDVERPVVGRGDLVGEARHRRRLVAARARPPKPGKTCLTVGRPRAAGPAPSRRRRARSVSAAPASRAEVLREARVRRRAPCARMPDDPARRSSTEEDIVAVAEHRRRQPALPASGLQDHGPARALEAAGRGPRAAGFTTPTGPAWGRVPVRPGDNDLTNKHPGRPVGQTITLQRSRARQRRPRRAQHADRDLADERVGRLPRPRRPRASCRSTRTSPAPAARSPTPRAATTSARSSPPHTRARSAASSARPTSTPRCSARCSPAAWSRSATSRATRCSTATRS